MYDRNDINRFIEMHKNPFAGYDLALAEIKRGYKQSHWIWYIFPQLRGIARNERQYYYGISGRIEAKCYLEHEVLGKHLREITEALMEHTNRPITDIMDNIDAVKLQSCMTLFDRVSPHDIYDKVLTTFFKGQRCQATDKLYSLYEQLATKDV